MRIFSAGQGNGFGFNSCKVLLYILALHTLATVPMGENYHDKKKKKRSILAVSSQLLIAAISMCSENCSVQKNFLVYVS